MIDRPVEGQDYPGSLPELRTWFQSDADCIDYLDWLRWPEGFVCPWCAGVGDWSRTPGVHRCNDCGRRTSVTSGTVFHKTRTPLTVWFEAAWLVMASKQGLSAQNLQRVTDLDSFQTAWTVLHKYRTVMSQVARSPLSGTVEVDEALVGGFDKPGVRGRGAAGKTLVIGAVEHNGRVHGRARLQISPNATSVTLAAFLSANVAPGSTVTRMAGRRTSRQPPQPESPTTGATCPHWANPPTRHYRECIGCSRSLNGCLLALIKVQSSPSTSRRTSTSSSSASTAADRATGVYCSYDSWPLPRLEVPQHTGNFRSFTASHSRNSSGHPRPTTNPVCWPGRHSIVPGDPQNHGS